MSKSEGSRDRIWDEDMSFYNNYFNRVHGGDVPPYEMHGATGSIYGEYMYVFSERLEPYLLKRRRDVKLTIIDIGCSYGDAIKGLTDYIRKRGYRVRSIGIDPSPFVKLAMLKGNIDYGIRGVVQSLPLPDQCGDIVICNKVLGRFKSEQKILGQKEILRVLKNDGIFLVGKTFGDEMTEQSIRDMLTESQRSRMIGEKRSFRRTTKR